MFAFGVGLTDIIGAFYDEDPFVSRLPEEIEVFGIKIPFGSIVWPLPPAILKKNEKRPCEKKP